MELSGQAILAPTLISGQDQFLSAWNFKSIGNEVYFIGKDQSGQYSQLWKSNGTAAGTQRITNHVPHVQYHMPTANQTYCYVAQELFNGPGSYYLHRPSVSVDPLVNYNGQMYDMVYGIALGNELVFPKSTGGLHITTGSNAPKLILDMTLAVDSKCAWDSKVYFGAMPNRTESNIELYVTDGTPNGSKLVKDIWPGPNSSTPKNLTVINNRLYFTAESQVAGVRELWVSDGTTAGTKFVAKLGKTEVSGPMLSLKPGSPKFYFVTNVGGYPLDVSSTSKSGVWESDGTAAGTRQLSFSTPVKGFVQLLPIINADVRFIANDAANVRCIYKAVPGNTATAPWSTTLLFTTTPGQTTKPIAAVNGKVFYTVGDKMWAFNNSSHAQVRPTETQASWSFDSSITAGTWVVNNDWLYFFANYKGGGSELYKVR